MIQRKPAKRLGANGYSEIKNHAWFRGFDWEALKEGRIPPPFRPKNKEDNFDSKNINEEWKDQDSDKMRENQLLLRRNSIQSLFNGYYFDSHVAKAEIEEASKHEKPKDVSKSTAMKPTDLSSLP